LQSYVPQDEGREEFSDWAALNLVTTSHW
jgi:hypothetical protein